MRVDLIAGSEWEAALADWGRLYSADPTATPFSSPGWARAWMRQWSQAPEPWLLRVRDDAQRVVGLAAFVLQRRGGVRILSMLGKEPGDYWDVLAEPAQREAVVAAVARELGRRRGAWDVCLVNCMPHGSPTPQALAAGAGLNMHALAPIACPSVELPDSFDAYLDTLPSRRRRNLRRHLRRLDEGDVELHDVRDPARLPELVAQWQELRRTQWAHQGKAISRRHLSPRFGGFMLEALNELLPSGTAVVWEFRHAGETVGVYFNFVDERAFYWYLGGIRPDALSLGIGKIAIGHGIRSSIASDRRVYDFTRGDDEYKYWYGAKTIHVARLVVGHGGARSRLALGALSRAHALRERQRSRPPAALRSRFKGGERATSRAAR
jgi:CelD/BcsL family acetyltransferase involved in cellulose biosynthesis